MTGFRRAMLFATLMLVGLLAGRAFWAWIVDDPANFSAQVYVAYFQGVDRAIERPIAGMGTAALLFAGISAVLAFRDRPVLVMLLGAFVCVLGSTLITVLIHVPINHQIDAFDPAAVPASWPSLRDRWWEFHKIRLAMLLGAMSLVSLAAILRVRPRHSQEQTIISEGS
jgi:uncharacterized membrane protein